MAVNTQNITEDYALYNGDCCEVLPNIPEGRVDYIIFSPPFADLYCYSDMARDLGNCRDYGEFFKHFAFMATELFRVLKPGRIATVHCIEIPAMKERDGYIGLKDFPGDIIRLFQSAGFIYHSRHTIWKDPLIEATRTKALGLMHKQLLKDSSLCRAGLPDYLLGFRKPGESAVPIEHKDGLTDYYGSEDPGGKGVSRNHNIWRAYASPVWMDIRQTLTLNKTDAREEKDEKHICPLQLDVINRCCLLWSNPGEVVLTPFMGIGSECYGALMLGRKSIGIELKPTYYRQAERNVREALDQRRHENPELFPELV